MGTILLIDAVFNVHYLSLDSNMKFTFVVFAVILILGLIQVKMGEGSVNIHGKAETVRKRVM